MKGRDLVTKYQKIWDEYTDSKINKPTPENEDNLLERGFVFQFDEGQKDIDVLFVGINPSYTNNKHETTCYRKEDVESISYFKSFNNIIEEIEQNDNITMNLIWTHLDLLVFRETQQSFIKSRLLRTEEGCQFVYKQLIISKQIIEYLNPKIIVVSNTAARHFLGKDKFERNGKKYGVWLGYDFEFDNDFGTDKIINNPKIKSYVFFTSMLSGQRALDKGSKQRLIWHIGNILNEISKT